MKALTALILLLTASWQAQGQLTNSGNMTLHAGTSIGFFGDLVNNGTLTDNATIVTMAGTLPQSIGGSTAISFNNLEISNFSTTGVTLDQDASITGGLTLTDGILTTSLTNMLVINHLATSSGASNSSHVAGPMTKTGNLAFTFPVGKVGEYAPVAISAPNLITDQFTAEYYHDSPNLSYNVSSKDASLEYVSQCEYWILDRTSGSADVFVTLSWNARSCAITEVSDVKVARWNGTQWKDHDNGGTTGNATAGSVTTLAAVTSFSPFTLGSSTIPLPIELLYFSAKARNSLVDLNWATATETNNEFFTVERSIDSFNFELLNYAEGAGSSKIRHEYHMTDESPKPGLSYYRLSQTDFDGQSETFPLQSVLVSPSGKSVIYPDPFTSSITIDFNGELQSRRIHIFDIRGNVIWSGGTGENSLVIELPEGIKPGIYVVEISSSFHIERIKIIKL